MSIDNNDNLILEIDNRTLLLNSKDLKEIVKQYLTLTELNKFSTYPFTPAESWADSKDKTTSLKDDTVKNPSIKEALKNDSGKIRMELLPPYALTSIAKVFTMGSKKYSDWNYMSNGGLAISRVYGALLRHLFAWYMGESLDKESKESHLAHAGSCIMILIELEKFGNKIDKPNYYESK